MILDDKNGQRPEAYPKPTEVDQQLKNQDEFNEELNSESSSHYPAQQNVHHVTEGATSDELREAQERMREQSSD